ncbi:hypothetical protein [Caulobacter sp. NIBR1757]|uniref:hypothetical protein n=1 Tax=Caulobacter sp. NIBR1757 TaxID=3016000 RepID=UPI0022F0B136|nr:hypothetical protein [Caulobacter sp. NIBR1757]WGM37682.1 hypothetical protein AMEJIAPC_00582 [Caulobacter sp. NIBR1757]
MTDLEKPALPSSDPALRGHLLPASGRRIAVAAALLAILALAWTQLAPWPRTGAVYVAKQMCSCLFLTGRSEASCRTDFGGYVTLYTLRIDRSGLPKTASVTTSLAIFRGEAVYEDGYGCRIAR